MIVVPHTHLNGKTASDTPFLSNDARLVRRGRAPEPQVLDAASGKYVRQNFVIFRKPKSEDVVLGYPIHQSCWNILSVLLTNDAGITLKRMISLYEILDDAAFFNLGMIWPHQYHGLEKYQLLLWTLPLEFPYVQNDPWEVGSPNQALVNRALVMDGRESEESAMIPLIASLPIELVEYIYSYLSLQDVRELQKINTRVKVGLPQRFWRSFLLPWAELGHFMLGDMGVIGSYSPLLQLQLAEGSLSMPGDLGMHMKNRHRVWEICKDLASQVTDVSTSKCYGFQPIEPTGYTPISIKSHKSQKSCLVESEVSTDRLFNDSRYSHYRTRVRFEGEIEATSVGSILLHYVGAGGLRYLSGMTLLPGEEKLGFITNQTRKISLGSKNILWLAVSKYGVIDMSFSDNIDEADWALSNEEFVTREVAVKRRILEPTESGLRSMKVQAKLDASKMVTLCIHMPDILDDEQVKNNYDESYIQSYSWLPRIPLSRFNLNPKTHLGRSWSGPLESELKLKFNPLKQVTFDHAPLSLITCWADGSSPYLAGFSFQFKNPEINPTVNLGQRYGAALDFPINGEAGEYISSITTFLREENRILQGIIIETNAGRRASFTVGKLDNCDIQRWNSGNGGRIVGFYGHLETVCSQCHSPNLRRY
ncbi:hypothetical protein ABW19_dt0208351 [Dactylella cylindrospora]|nr:hypothetical protein ABW19_dt0208351 [Dactylella cylindrospora]